MSLNVRVNKPSKLSPTWTQVCLRTNQQVCVCRFLYLFRTQPWFASAAGCAQNPKRLGESNRRSTGLSSFSQTSWRHPSKILHFFASVKWSRAVTVLISKTIFKESWFQKVSGLNFVSEVSYVFGPVLDKFLFYFLVAQFITQPLMTEMWS